MMTYAIAPNPKWYFLDATGKPASYGFLKTYDNLDRTTPKFVFADPGGLFPYTDPIALDGTGGTPVPIYWDTTSPGLYYIIVTDAAGNKIFDMGNFPIAGSGGVTPITTQADIQNHIINGQFLFIDAASSAASLISPAPEGDMRIAPASGFFKQLDGSYSGATSGWRFAKAGGAGESSSIQFVDVTAIGTTLPVSPSANATRYFRYTLNSPGAPQTDISLYQATPGVETYSGETITVSFDCRSTSAGIGVFEILQFYGTGGTPSAPTSVTHNFNFSVDEWTRISFQINVPSVVGKNKGTNNDDQIDIYWNFPLNVVGSFELTSLQIQRGAYGTSAYVYQTYNQDQYKVLIDLITNGTIPLPPPFVTGELKWMSVAAGPIPGWIVITTVNDTLGSAASGAVFAGTDYLDLYILWWDSFTQAECVVFGGRGASALADFNANKRMTVPGSILGTVISAAGNSAYQNAAFGFLEGAREHTLTIPEIPSHQHTYQGPSGSIVNLDTGIIPVPEPAEFLTGAVGGGLPHNNMQPTFYLLLYVKL